ncbi:CLC_0170 family protein [Lederbergia wuyishanensis]|uniref:Membrane protein n=1 Tax=Lederbergia wuyishanensis TaxID=1347903 RepID=A0ABU0D951_9BACI|nr:CLC_0170 family protein [Lederbergia wuyishanensis]MCJ8007558.1 hypothetical protein [Lederbergia wuyishanensis]MDQ0344861.1 putative membrane protein [Lederbergia wuyishanensis]
MHYNYYFVVLLIATGLFILLIDVNTFKKIQMKKEKKFALFLGWTNVIAGMIFLIGYWAYQKWFW